MCCRMWCRTIWMERNGKEVELTIPSQWIVKDKVLWPSGVDARAALAKQKTPKKGWRQFNLLRIKHTSGSGLV